MDLEAVRVRAFIFRAGLDFSRVVYFFPCRPRLSTSDKACAFQPTLSPFLVHRVEH